MAKYMRKFLRFLIFHREIKIIVLSAGIIFCALSFYSYSPSDPTFFFYTSASYQVHNWMGIIGAYLAAFFFYFWGISCWWWIGALLFYVYTLMSNSTEKESDRYIAYMLMPWASSLLCTMYSIDKANIATSGGFFGHYTAKLLRSVGDVAGTYLFAHTILLILLIVISRFSLIYMIRLVARSSLFSYGLRYLVKPCYQAIAWCIVTIYHYVILGKNYLIDGICSYVLPEKSGASLQNLIYENELEINNLEEFWSAMQEHQQVKNISAVSPEKEIVLHDNGTRNDEYRLPQASIFIAPDQEQQDQTISQELEKKAHILEEKLERFGILGKVTAIKKGPVITLYEYQPQIDSKISKILALEDDLALALQALSIRIIAPIPGKSVVGFEVANKQRKNVLFSELVISEQFVQSNAALPLIVGKDTIGSPFIIDLARMPHLLVAGSTGSGKSVALNTMLMSLLCKKTPDQLSLILIDPKRLEFAQYADIAHLLFPIIADPRQAIHILAWVVAHMEDRYALMATHGARQISDYQNLCNKNSELEPMPYLVIIIDELADVMMTAGADVQHHLVRISQMARAAGIHLIAATQRPSVDVITGLIKVNFPSRMAFRVTSKVDSRTILDAPGADKLLGHGDLLFLDGAHGGMIKRAHGAFVSDKEISEVVNHIKEQRQVCYKDYKLAVSSIKSEDDDIDQTLFDHIKEYLKEVDDVSISLIQRRFRIGYNRSARIIDKLEAQGLISPASSSKTRKVIR